MIQNKQFNRYSLHSIMLPVVLFAYGLKLNMLTMKGVIWTLWKMLCNDFKLSSECSEENVGETFVEHFINVYKCLGWGTG